MNASSGTSLQVAVLGTGTISMMPQVERFTGRLHYYYG